MRIHCIEARCTDGTHVLTASTSRWHEPATLGLVTPARLRAHPWVLYQAAHLHIAYLAALLTAPICLPFFWYLAGL